MYSVIQRENEETYFFQVRLRMFLMFDKKKHCTKRFKGKKVNFNKNDHITFIKI